MIVKILYYPGYHSEGSGAWIRTREMAVPKTAALPLGYARSYISLQKRKHVAIITC
jgi:hypothetical protein